MSAATRRAVLELDQSPALPRLDAAFVRALNRLIDRRRPMIQLGLTGDVMKLRWEPPSGATWPVQDSYRFRLGAHGGWLALDPAGVSELLREPRADLLPRELRYVLMAEALQPAVEQLERQYRVRFEWLPDDDEAARHPPGEHRAAFHLTSPDSGMRVNGQICFDQPAALDAHVPPLSTDGTPAPAAPAFDELRFALNFCLGRTRISLREVREIRPGDIVSLETFDAKGSALRVVARVGGANGRRLVAIAEGQRITLQPMKGRDMNRDPHPDATATGEDDAFDDNTAPTLDRLDALEVTLRFEVGELSVSLGELKALRPGHVFELPQPLNRSMVRILAHGNVLGKGQLVAVGDRLGVRVSEFAATDL